MPGQSRIRHTSFCEELSRLLALCGPNPLWGLLYPNRWGHQGFADSMPLLGRRLLVVPALGQFIGRRNFLSKFGRLFHYHTTDQHNPFDPGLPSVPAIFAKKSWSSNNGRWLQSCLSWFVTQKIFFLFIVGRVQLWRQQCKPEADALWRYRRNWLLSSAPVLRLVPDSWLVQVLATGLFCKIHPKTSYHAWPIGPYTKLRS